MESWFNGVAFCLSCDRDKQKITEKIETEKADTRKHERRPKQWKSTVLARREGKEKKLHESPSEC